MAELSLNEVHTMDVVFDNKADLKCPACEERLTVVATVRTKSGSVQHVGTSGFDKQYSVHIDAKVESFTIQHQCHPKE